MFHNTWSSYNLFCCHVFQNNFAIHDNSYLLPQILIAEIHIFLVFIYERTCTLQAEAKTF